MVNSTTTVTVIDACSRAMVPVLLKSKPGMGKSSIVRALAAVDNEPCEMVLGSIREPADFAGLPIVTDEGVQLDAPAWAKRLIAAGRGWLLLDELTTSPPAVQGAMLTVALDHIVGDTKLPESVKVIAAANPAECAAGGYELEPPLANRFCHIDFGVTSDEWLEGMSSGWSVPASRAVAADAGHKAMARAQVTGFIRTRPDLLHVMESDPARRGGAWPSHRTWSMLAATLAHLRDDDADALRCAAYGLVGAGAGAEFLAWRETMDMPTPAELIDDPAMIDWANERPDRAWAALTAVVTFAAHAGTKTAWTKAWGPLAAAGAVKADVAGSVVRSHMLARPADTSVPAIARSFEPALRDAGLLPSAEDEVA